jgi:anti-anti-sigma factor
MTEPTVRYTINKANGTTQVRVIGELDLMTVPTLDRLLAEVERPDLRRIELDLRQVTFVDSTGISLFIELHRAAAEDGRILVLTQLTPTVARVLEITGLLAELTAGDDDSPPPLGSPR